MSTTNYFASSKTRLKQLKKMKKTKKINNRPEQQGWNHTTELCVDVKTYLRGDARMRKGRQYPGLLTRESEEHMTFVETASQKKMKRNPHIYEGEFITVTQRDDGTYHLHFRAICMDKGFNVERFAFQVYNEVLWGLDGLVEKE
jgi:hypothetical protein